jgi:phytoene synthase
LSDVYTSRAVVEKVMDTKMKSEFTIDSDWVGCMRSANAIAMVGATPMAQITATISTPRDPLARAYAHCEAVTRQHSRSFFLATQFLPAAKRQAIRTFYAFCRTTDDLVDVPHGSARESMHDLAEWRMAARRATATQTNPVLLAWSDIRDRYAVPQHFVEELIDGCMLDLQVCRYETYEQLRRYCYLVASTVGLVSMHIIGSADGKTFDAPTTQAAIELGIALQLTNILRDIGEDLARGRIYLPRNELAEFGYTERELNARNNNRAFRQLMQFLINRTEKLYADNVHSIAKLNPDGRMAVGSAIWLYRGILNKIQQNNFDVFSRRAHLSTLEKLLRLPGIYARINGL